MANRVLVGKKDTNVFGVFVSKPTVDVTTASEDELIFNTNQSTGAALGMFQFGFTSGTNTSTTGSQNSNSSSNQTVGSLGQNLGVAVPTDGGFIETNSTTGGTVSITTSASNSLRGITHTNPSTVSFTVINIKELF